MAYDSKAVANRFLELATANGQTLSPMKLLKLLYFAHGWYLAITGKPLLDEAIEAWNYGPVVPTIYHEFKRFGNDSITEPAKEATGQGSRRSKDARLPESDGAAFVQRLLQRVWEIYGPFSAVQLSRMTHQEGSPWSKTVEQNTGSKGYFPKSVEIDDNLIKDYFIGLKHTGTN